MKEQLKTLDILNLVIESSSAADTASSLGVAVA